MDMRKVTRKGKVNGTEMSNGLDMLGMILLKLDLDI